MLLPYRLLSLALVLNAAAQTRPIAPSQERLRLEAGDRICLLGGAIAERMQHHGWLETRLQGRFPDLELSFRNLGFSADTLDVHRRTMNFGKLPTDAIGLNVKHDRFVVWDRYLDHCDADVVLAFFGYNESFAGNEGLEAFESDLERFIEHTLGQQYNGVSAPRLVLVSSIPQEDLRDPNLPDGSSHNRSIVLYNAVMGETAARMGVLFVDAYGPMAERYDASTTPLTINGIHLSERGNEVFAEVLDELLFGRSARRAPELAVTKTMRDAVNRKNLYWFNHYRATDGYNVYGGRSRMVYDGKVGEAGLKWSNYEVLQREMEVLDAMARNIDRQIWALARGDGGGVQGLEELPALIDVATNKPGGEPGGAHMFRGGEKAVSMMTPADGMRVQLFASEEQFPELVNPVQMAWDTKGRLWVAAWPTYPHWIPGQPMNDKLLILEDTDGDGRADTCEAFADDLHNPTGFEFWNNGVLVANAPDLLFLEDTDGDDRADRRERMLHGISSGDTHHSANSFVLGPDGALYFQEGTFHMSQVESIYGPIRNHNGCVWRFDPRNWRVERYIPYNFANPHGHVFDHWGQDFVTDGTGNNNYYALAFSGFVQHPDKHRGYFTYFKQRSRPAAATEIISSAHFPDENQGNYLIANVIGFRGIFQYEVLDDGSGFGAEEVQPIVFSDDQNFRPTDLEIGPDGALYFVDWHNPIIGHLQHHLRDPSRDQAHGRVYRVTCEGRELSRPVAIAGRPVEELLTLLEHPEDRVRYRTRIELSGRNSARVMGAIGDWLGGINPADPRREHHLLEGLWLYRQHGGMDQELLVDLLRSEDYRVRAAATRVLRYGREQVEGALALLSECADDVHPRVRLEAVVAASSFGTADAAGAALLALKHPTDRFMDYALAETMRALAPSWQAALRSGGLVAVDNPVGIEYLLSRVGPEELMALPRVPGVLQVILTRPGVQFEWREEAVLALAEQRDSTVAAELLRAIRETGSRAGSQATGVLRDLGDLLIGTIGGPAGPSRPEIVSLAEYEGSYSLRSLGLAALVTHDESAEQAWAASADSRDGLRTFLSGVSRIPDEGLRAGLYGRVRPLMFSIPPGLRTEPSTSVAGQPTVAFYDPHPTAATLEAFSAREPVEQMQAERFGLKLPYTKRGDAFGLMFRATLFAPQGGRYTFFTRSDDGSRLFVDGECIVNNDGSHGVEERSGEVKLSAGPHAITLTYFDSGGAEALSASWKGPGFKKQEIPSTALGSPSGESIRPDAILAMSHIPGNEEQKFQDAARLMVEDGLLAHAVAMLKSIPEDRWPEEQIVPVIETMAAHVAGMPPDQRTRADVASALELGRDLAGALGSERGELARRQLEGLGGSIVLVRTVPHAMVYDVVEFWVEAGEPAAIVFQNNDVMPHNLVITRPDGMETVGQAAELMPGDKQGQDYVPDSDAVLWSTGLLLPGESERIAFSAPEEPGDFPFVCTFPGHWRVMNGVMHVVDKLEGAMQPVRRDVQTQGVAAREFVRDWKLSDFADLLQEGWERGRSSHRGHALFFETGCNTCHAHMGHGAGGGPDLSKTHERYKGLELLRQILEPSAEILEGYHYHHLLLDDGSDVIGRVVSEDDRALVVMENLQEPEDLSTIEKAWIEDRRQQPLSAMPTGMLVTLEEDEILDLLAFLQSESSDHDSDEH